MEKSDAVKAILANLLNNVAVAGSTEGDRSALIKSWSEALDTSDSLAKGYGKEALELDRKYLLLVQAYQRSIIQDTVEITQKTNELLACIRSELELISDFSALESSTSDMYFMLRKSVEKMQSHYAE